MSRWSVISVTWYSKRWDTCESTKSQINTRKRHILSAERWEKLPFNAAEEQNKITERRLLALMIHVRKKTWQTKGEFRSVWVRLQKLCWKANPDFNRAGLDQYCDWNNVENCALFSSNLNPSNDWAIRKISVIAGGGWEKATNGADYGS